jgi:hypothetical protein
MEEKIKNIILKSKIIMTGQYPDYEVKIDCDNSSKEITAHIFEFIAWLRSGGVMQEDESEHRYIEESRKTDEEIYDYWLTEVKK